MKALMGMILVGGQSQRMGTDKSQMRLTSHGHTQRESLYRLLRSVLEECVFSINREQEEDPYFQDKISITDKYKNKGPMGGILSVMKSFPRHSFLVLACDMPFIDINLVQELLFNRDSDGVFYELDSQIEPLCGIYEKELYGPMNKAFSKEERSLRSMLTHANVKRIKWNRGENFLNLNTPQDIEGLVH